MASSRKQQQSPCAMRILIERQRASGLSKSTFCAQAGISQATFYYWQRKLLSITPTAKAKGSEIGFIELQPSPCYRLNIRVETGK